MVIGIIGESCTGKSTIAEEISKRLNAKIFSGKDYLKLAKNEADAQRQFIELLVRNEDSDDTIIYVITDAEHLSLLPRKVVRILVTAELDVIKERFARRMNGRLPPPVAAMLEKKHGMFDNGEYNLKIDNAGEDLAGICDRIVEICGKAL